MIEISSNRNFHLKVIMHSAHQRWHLAGTEVLAQNVAATSVVNGETLS